MQALLYNSEGLINVTMSLLYSIYSVIEYTALKQITSCRLMFTLS